MNFGEKRFIYALYPFDTDGNIAGVYVGSTYKISRRMANHRNNNKCHLNQKELHELIEKNGYCFQVIDEYVGYDSIREYDWIQFFELQNVRLFNTRKSQNANYKRCKKFGTPIWTGGGVAWR